MVVYWLIGICVVIMIYPAYLLIQMCNHRWWNIDGTDNGTKVSLLCLARNEDEAIAQFHGQHPNAYVDKAKSLS